MHDGPQEEEEEHVTPPCPAETQKFLARVCLAKDVVKTSVVKGSMCVSEGDAAGTCPVVQYRVVPRGARLGVNVN